MSTGDQINLRPHFRDEEEGRLPCEGEVGDLYVLTPLHDGEPDPSPQGLASLWFCVKKPERDSGPAIWARVRFDGFATCDWRPPNPSQMLPELKEG